MRIEPTILDYSMNPRDDGKVEVRIALTSGTTLAAIMPADEARAFYEAAGRAWHKPVPVELLDMLHSRAEPDEKPGPR